MRISVVLLSNLFFRRVTAYQIVSAAATRHGHVVELVRSTGEPLQTELEPRPVYKREKYSFYCQPLSHPFTLLSTGAG